MGSVLALAFGAFIGFEATAIYREEARTPNRTVPRATYVAVGFLGLAVPGTSHTGFMNLAEVIWNRGRFPPRRRVARVNQVRACSGYAGHGFRLSAGR